MKAIFEKTVDILVKAYLSGTLEHGNCCACAVGNIIADSCNYKYIKSHSSCQEWTWLMARPVWYKDGVGVIYCDQIESTGYTLDQLQRIEKAFEDVYKIRSMDPMFQGLMQVLDVLADIHKIDLTVKEQAKQLFVKS